MTSLLVGLVGTAAPRLATTLAIEAAQGTVVICSPADALSRAGGLDALVFDVGVDPEALAPVVRALASEPHLRDVPRLVVAGEAVSVKELAVFADAAVVPSSAPQEVLDRSVALVVARARTARRARALDEDAAALSHDARVLLGLVVGYGANLRDEIVGPLSDAQREHVLNILEAAASTTALIDRHVAAMRTRDDEMIAERPTTRRRLVDFAETARETAALFQNLAGAKGVRLSVAASGPAPCWCDAMQIKQALVNLIANALKFTPSGGTVVVSARAVESGTRRDVELAVDDSGPGIPEAERTRIFERGVRLERDRASAGSGLGLSIVAGVGEMHGGATRVETSPTGGASFVLSIPFDRRRASDLRLVPSPAPARVE